MTEPFHEAAVDLMTAHAAVRSALNAVRWARGLGKWTDPRHRGDDAARNAIRDLEATLDRAGRRLERLVAAAAQTRRGEPLRLTIEERIAR
jgi:hypothetical protein